PGALAPPRPPPGRPRPQARPAGDRSGLPPLPGGAGDPPEHPAPPPPLAAGRPPPALLPPTPFRPPSGTRRLPGRRSGGGPRGPRGSRPAPRPGGGPPQRQR